MHSPRRRLNIFIIATTLPFLLYFSYFNYHNFQDKQNSAFAQLDTIATLTATEHKQIQEGARQLLIAISTVPLLHNSSCSNYLSSLKSNYIRYQNFGVIDQTGRIVCAADLQQAQNNPPSQNLINQTLTTQSFTLGTYYATANGSAVINYAYPLSKNKVVYASLSLDWVTSFVKNLNLTQNSTVTNILDKNGTVLSRVPINSEAVGQNFITDPLVQEILTNGQGQTTKTGIDHIQRLYSFTALDDTKSIFIAVGTSKEELFRSVKKSILESTLIFALVFIFAVTIAHQIGNKLILKQVESLQKIDKLKDEFISLASHQLRSPMTAIRWIAELVLDSKKTELSKRNRLSVQKIHVTSLRLITLTSNLLNISRIESDTFTINIKTVNLHSLLTHLINNLTTAFSQKKLKVKLHLKVKNIPCDSILLTEIINIILDNAISYSNPHTTVTVSTLKTKSNLVLKISNYGIGIPPSQASQIFTRFYRADNARAHIQNGNGLGLYLARLMARKLSGDLTFTSDINKQTTFILTLPINKIS